MTADRGRPGAGAGQGAVAALDSTRFRWAVIVCAACALCLSILLPAAVGALAAEAAKPATAPARPPATAPQAPGAVRFAPKARQLSTYVLEGRLEVADRDITFQAPPAYQDKFAFWTGRMKGQKRYELYQFQTSTQERAKDGTVPFKRILTRFQLELEKEGRPLAAMGSLQKDMTTQAWEGTLDPLGNVKEIRKSQGVDNPDAAELWVPMIERLFPPLPGARDLATGKGFTDVVSVPLPSQLKIRGLEEIHVMVTRDYLLKEAAGGLARFEVRTTYAPDPKTPPTEAGTTCAIKGGGTGEATFDLKRGVFLGTTLPTQMTIEVTAPLQPLEGQPANAEPGSGTTRIELDLRLSGQQTVRRYWGEEED